MKWFKHQSTARNDERISMLEDRTGLEGYGFYFKMLEIVAEVVDATDKHEVIYSLSRWGRQTNIASKKWLFLSQCCADVGLMIVCRLPDDGLTSDYRMSVKIPNLLKYRDNHTRNLQVANKQDIEEDKEVEVELEEDKKPMSQQVKPVADKVPFDEIVNLYHKTLPKNPRIMMLNAKRKGQIAARWKSGVLPDLKTWEEYFNHVAESGFLMGHCDPAPGRKRFVADLEWITNESNFTKIAEGKYHGKV